MIVKIHVYTCIVLAVSIEESLKFVRVHFNVVNFFGILHGPTNIINELYETISSKLQLHKPLTNWTSKHQNWKILHKFTVCETLGSIFFVYMHIYICKTQEFYNHIMFCWCMYISYKYTNIHKACKYVYINII